MKALSFAGLEEARLYFQNMDSAHSLVLFASPALVKELSLLAPPSAVLCSTKGEYTPDGYRDGVIAGFEYQSEHADIVEILHPPVLSEDKLRISYDKVKTNANAFLLLLCDGKGGMEEVILSSLYFMDPLFKIIGGSAADDDSGETFLYIGNKRVRNVGIFFNLFRQTAILKENIYARTGKLLLVTEADVLRRTVYSFNRRPAAEEYARALGVAESALPDYFLSHPLGKQYEDDIIISAPMKVNGDKSVTFYSQVMSNTFMELLQPEDPLSVLEQTLKKSPFPPSFVLNINCTLRNLLFKRDGLWGEFDRRMTQFCGNTSGFVSYGEQYYKKHANQTMVLLLVE